MKTRSLSRIYVPVAIGRFGRLTSAQAWLAHSLFPKVNEPSKRNRTKTYSFHKASDSYFRMLDRDGQLYQRRYQIGLDGKETNVVEKQVDFVIGSGNHVRTYLHRTARNTLVELPLARYSEKGGYWAMNPGYDRPDHPEFQRSVAYDCMFCHNAYPKLPPDSDSPGAEPVFAASIPEGIDCQRCHGPGGRHVQLAGYPGTKVEEIRKAIVNPARLSHERQLEICMQCHLETTSFPLPNAIRRFDRTPFSYMPGIKLEDFQLYFDHAPGTGHDDKFEIVSAAYRLRRSKCFQKSSGVLLCTTCHNPHDIPRGQAAEEHYNSVCRQWHDADLNQLMASGRHTESTGCVGCHMPKRRAEDVVHAVMTDHYIQRRPPARNLLAELAERHETSETSHRGEVVLYYPQQLPATPESELYLAVAQVRQQSNLIEGAARLAAAIQKYRPGNPEVYLELADAWSKEGQSEKAIALYQEAVRRGPTLLVALRKLGVALKESGQNARAVEVLKQALTVAPSDAASWHELALVYLQAGQNSQALASFEKAIALDPDRPEPLNNLGSLWMESGNQNRAESAFREAIRIQPSYAEAHNNLGALLSTAGDFAQARTHFEAALRFKPGYAAAQFNYAAALVRINRLDQARLKLEAALQADPRLSEAHELLGNVLAAKGQVQGALRQYREALRIDPDFLRAHLSLGLALAALGDSSEALQHIRRAAESSVPQERAEALQTLRNMGNR